MRTGDTILFVRLIQWHKNQNKWLMYVALIHSGAILDCKLKIIEVPLSFRAEILTSPDRVCF